MNKFEEFSKIKGYKSLTAYWNEFSIAEKSGPERIIALYYEKIEETKNDYKAFTELVLVLNQKLWESYEHNDNDQARLYEKLWSRAVTHAFDALHGEELDYYIQTTD